jgi:membrane protein DedA with SNARE-associated domain
VIDYELTCALRSLPPQNGGERCGDPMNDLAIQILAFIKAHPEWAICVIGVTAFGESFAFLSLLFPGTAILIASGTLVSEGILSPFPTVAAGIVGAVLGDLVSFWLGRKFGTFLPGVWPFRTHPERLTWGTSFFGRFGGSSVFIGRFFGPLRAVIPLVAGIMQMPSLRFYIANVLSAIVWVPVLVLSGDLVTQVLSDSEDLTTKILSITIVAAVVSVLAFWIRRQFIVR